jgi:lipopolysaccharide/colanic/teichoic acid biosynthesis glycosyltransferase
VRPGITGYWQVQGRNSANFDERLRMDVAYIRDMSLRTDAKVVVATFASVIKRNGA